MTATSPLAPLSHGPHGVGNPHHRLLAAFPSSVSSLSQTLSPTTPQTAMSTSSCHSVSTDSVRMASNFPAWKVGLEESLKRNEGASPPA
ncbi:hypothetical protein HK101_006939, partial [Irineochytrium annulatum]